MMVHPAVEYYTAVKRKELQPQVMFGNTALRERGQMQKAAHGTDAFMSHS